MVLLARLVVSLRDGRKFFGVLRSYDQYGKSLSISLFHLKFPYSRVGNLLMTDVFERYYVDLEYGEEYRGVYLIRGENVVMVGQLVSPQRQCTLLSLFRMRKSFKQFLSGWPNSNDHLKSFCPNSRHWLSGLQKRDYAWINLACLN